jgi:hypothetical protein
METRPITVTYFSGNGEKQTSQVIASDPKFCIGESEEEFDMYNHPDSESRDSEKLVENIETKIPLELEGHSVQRSSFFKCCDVLIHTTQKMAKWTSNLISMIFNREKAELNPLGHQHHWMRASFPIHGGYLRPMYIEFPYFTEFSHIMTPNEFQDLHFGVTQLLKSNTFSYCFRIHATYDILIIVLATIFAKQSWWLWTLFSILLIASTCVYQYNLQRIKQDVTSWLEIENESLMPKQAHWQWGPSDFGISFEFPKQQ